MRGKRILSLMLIFMLSITLFPMPVQAATGDKLIALTFDDGPHRTYTRQLLDGLRQRGVNVTFFMIGSNAASNNDLVQIAYDDGHQIGNHTYSHPNLNSVGYNGVKSQLSSTAAVLDGACGSGTDYLVRPPYGNANSTVLSALDSPAILWSVDTNDWKYRDANHVYSHIVNNAYDGAIILCHDIYSSTVSGALQAVDTLLARGYEFVTVGELYRRRGVTLQDGTKVYSCSNNGTDLGPVQEPIITYETTTEGVRVTIDSPSGAPVYYTLNGSRFNQQSTLYTGSFVVSQRAEIQAIAAFNLNGDRSEIVTRKLFIIHSREPQITVEENILKLSCQTKGAPIYYSLDGITYNRYTGPVEISPGTTIRAYAGGGNYTYSDQIMRHYSEKGNLFADVFPGDWYYGAIDAMAAEGILTGIGNDAFSPDTSTTRGMLVVMLYRYSEETLEDGWDKTNAFTDVPNDAWYSEAIEWAYRNEIVTGYSDSIFRPDQAITREEMAKVIAKFMSHRGHSIEIETDCRNDFYDGAHIQEWAVESVDTIVTAGLMKGDGNGNFMPAKSAARAEVATVLTRLMELEQ